MVGHGGAWRVYCRFRAKREQLKRFHRLFPERQGHNLALTVLHAPSSLDGGSEAQVLLLLPAAREAAPNLRMAHSSRTQSGTTQGRRENPRTQSSDDAFQETSARYRAVEPEQWLQRHPAAGSS